MDGRTACARRRPSTRSGPTGSGRSRTRSACCACSASRCSSGCCSARTRTPGPLVVLAVSGFTDWLDGVLARKLNQMSALGALLDPLADRLYILATLVGLVLRHVIPLWLAVVIVGRDVVLACALPLLRRAGYGAAGGALPRQGRDLLPALRVPAAAARHLPQHRADVARPIAWGFTIWGTALYLWAGVVYLTQVRRADPRRRCGRYVSPRPADRPRRPRAARTARPRSCCRPGHQHPRPRLRAPPRPAQRPRTGPALVGPPAPSPLGCAADRASCSSSPTSTPTAAPPRREGAHRAREPGARPPSTGRRPGRAGAARRAGTGVGAEQGAAGRRARPPGSQQAAQIAAGQLAVHGSGRDGDAARAARGAKPRRPNRPGRQRADRRDAYPHRP